MSYGPVSRIPEEGNKDVPIQITRIKDARPRCSMRFQRMGSSSHEHHARGDGSNEQDADFVHGHAVDAQATKRSCAGSACYEEIMRWKRMLRRDHALEAHATLLVNDIAQGAQLLNGLRIHRLGLSVFLDSSYSPDQK